MNPQHYTAREGKKQPIELMFEGFTAEEFRGFCMGNVIKYTMRAGKKNEDLEGEDLEKARTYLGYMINLFNSGHPLLGVMCKNCKGKGWDSNGDCKTCSGIGWLKE